MSFSTFFKRAHPATTVAIQLDVAQHLSGIYVGADGNVALRLEGDAAYTVFPGVKGGTFIPLQIHSVSATGTTVASPTTNIVGYK